MGKGKLSITKKKTIKNLFIIITTDINDNSNNSNNNNIIIFNIYIAHFA